MNEQPYEHSADLSLSKFISVHTTRDTREEELRMRSEEVLRLAESRGFDGLAEEQHAYLDAFWSRADVETASDPRSSRGCGLMRLACCSRLDATA
ncbi:hypothetical protein POTG_01949 [Paenibacillus sp. oral taxon 786 str. D14]|uniref:hypothetical protein n=1 Tax=Paenibacillus sp. oral taxon 786 TaxID=652715 RepID=UPI0001AFCD0C|nr:hypothetical protein [Paenibacillus sp. oral taxon 786]EES73654.1 hypothetical protein POTG_01949 [Paenibacillus sp. oral taxon 786 str. D14]